MESAKDYFDFEFLLDPSLASGIDPANTHRQAAKPILHLITSKFPAGNFAYPLAKTGKPPGLACNSYPTTKGEILVCLFVLQKRDTNGCLDCGIIAKFFPHYHIFRPWYKPDKIDFESVANLRKSLETVLTNHLGAKDVKVRDKASLPPP